MVAKLTRSLFRLNSMAHPAIPMISVHFLSVQQNFQGLIWLTWENCPSVSQLLQFGVGWYFEMMHMGRQFAIEQSINK